MRAIRLALIAIPAFIAALAGAPVAAQTSGDLRGTVADAAGGTLPGVTVEIRSPALQGTRTTATDASGVFRFPVVPPGVYALAATLPGFTREEVAGIRVALGETAHVPVTLVLATRAEVEVSAEVPFVDTSTARIGTAVPASTLARLPIGRNFATVALTLAGTSLDAGGITVYGATGLENNYVVDGLNTTGIRKGQQGKQLNLEFVQEVEVRTGGYEAEFGRAMGASINVLTKSGGNDFHGDAFGYYDAPSLNSSDRHEGERRALNQALPEVPTRYDAGLDLGGYFLQDRVWFFGAYDRVRADQDYRRVESLTFTPTDVVNNYVGGTDVTTLDVFAAKLTLRAGPSHTFVASVFGDPTKFDGRFSGVVGPASAVLARQESGGTDATVRWDGLFGSAVIAQAQYGYHGESDGWSSDFEDAIWRSDYRADWGRVQVLPGAGPGELQRGTLRRNTWTLSATSFLGRHEVKGGAAYENLSSTTTRFFSGGGAMGSISDAGGALYMVHEGLAKVPLNCQVKTDGSRGNFGFVSPFDCNGWETWDRATSNPRTRNLAFYLQDAWKVLPNLTVNAGVRYEDQRLDDANGVERVALTGQWSPRAGVVWDPLANGRSKVFASFGRYYQVIPQELQLRALGNQVYVYAYNYTEDHLDLVNDGALFPYSYIVGADYVPKGLKGMFQDELIAGVEAEVWKDWSVGVKGIYRGLGRILEDRCDVYSSRSGLAGKIPPESVALCVMINPGEGELGLLRDPENPDCWENFPKATRPKACESVRGTRIFRGLQLDVKRRFSRGFQLQASYLLSRLEGTYDGFVNETYGQTMPGLAVDFDRPEVLPNTFGRLGLDRRHQVNLSGFYAFPFGLAVGLNAAWASGAPVSIRGNAGGMVYQTQKYLEPRGSWGELPSTYNVDLHLEYGLRLGSVAVTPVVDVFNLTNVQTATRRNEVYNSLANGNQSPPFTNPTNPFFGKDTRWQNPRVVRLGARVSF